jgi:hypothetical protein
MGYASLFNSLSFTVETHMLKPFPERVEATQHFIDELIVWTGKNAAAVEHARKTAVKQWNAEQHFRYRYSLTDEADSLLFKGYKAVYKTSAVTGLRRLSYDRTQPYTKFVPYYATHQPMDSVRIPKAYIVSVSTAEVIERLKANGVVFRTIGSDSVIGLSTLRVTGYETAKVPYEGHYLHSAAAIAEASESITVLRGSLWIPVRQERSRFVLSVLEPAAEDSYFSWNFFDSYLQQKEYFSAYVFEDIAVELLKHNPALADELNRKKQADPSFAASPEAQLDYIYRNSPYFEAATVNRLPVFKVY